jgi:hypothetical protein
LQYSYIWTEGDLALRQWGTEIGTPEPRNNVQQNVLLEIPPFTDADGNHQDDCFDQYIMNYGDNHCGYMGYRTTPWNNGAIDVVAKDCRG